MGDRDRDEGSGSGSGWEIGIGGGDKRRGIRNDLDEYVYLRIHPVSPSRSPVVAGFEIPDR